MEGVAPFRASRLLDEIQHLAALGTFAPAPFLDSLAAEVAALGVATFAELGDSLDRLRSVLGEVDRFAQKTMHIHLTQTPGAELPQQLRTLVSTTIVHYASSLPLLGERIGPTLRRQGGEATVGRVLDAAAQVLAMRAELRTGVLALAKGFAQTKLPSVTQLARDRSLEARERERWGQARLDLEHIAAAGEAIDTGQFAERLLCIPPPPDEPEPDPLHSSRFALLEID